MTSLRSRSASICFSPALSTESNAASPCSSELACCSKASCPAGVALGAHAGAVPGTLSRQMLLAVLARDAGDEAGASALAREVARWAAALGTVRVEAQAAGFLAGADPTAPPENDS